MIELLHNNWIRLLPPYKQKTSADQLNLIQSCRIKKERGKEGESPPDRDLVVVAGVMVEEEEVEKGVVQGSRLENLFHQLDRNQDGRIDAEELALGLQDLGYAHISPDQIKLFLKKSDATKSGDLSLKEFIEHLSR